MLGERYDPMNEYVLQSHSLKHESNPLTWPYTYCNESTSIIYSNVKISYARLDINSVQFQKE